MNDTSSSAPLPPTFSDLLDYAEGRLTGNEHQRIANFLAEHPEEVAADWAWVQDFAKVARSVELHPLPTTLQHTLNDLYTDGKKEPVVEKVGAWMTKVRRVVAELVEPESSPGFAAEGLRTKTFESPSRQWTYKSDLFEIWVNTLVRPDQRFDLHGQVFSGDTESEGTAGSVQLVRNDREYGLTAVDAYGEFVIRRIPAGEYALVIAGSGVEVFCTPVRFGC